MAPFDDPDLRRALLAAHARNELVIDVTSRDRVREAGFSASDTYLARGTIDFFQQFIAEHRDELDALRLIYNQPYGARGLTYAAVKELARALEAPPHGWTAEALWGAYARVE